MKSIRFALKFAETKNDQFSLELKKFQVNLFSILILSHLWPSKRNRSVSISNVYEGNFSSQTKMYYWLSAFWDCAGFDSAPSVQTPEKYSFWSSGIRIVRKINTTKVWNVAKIISETSTSGTQSPKQVNYIANLQKVCQILWICYLGLNGHKV